MVTWEFYTPPKLVFYIHLIAHSKRKNIFYRGLYFVTSYLLKISTNRYIKNFYKIKQKNTN